MGGRNFNYSQLIPVKQNFQLLYFKGGRTLLSGFACTLHPAVTGSNPMHNIYAFSIFSLIFLEKGDNKQIIGQYFGTTLNLGREPWSSG